MQKKMNVPKKKQLKERKLVFGPTVAKMPPPARSRSFATSKVRTQFPVKRRQKRFPIQSIFQSILMKRRSFPLDQMSLSSLCPPVVLFTTVPAPRLFKIVLFRQSFSTSIISLNSLTFLLWDRFYFSLSHLRVYIKKIAILLTAFLQI